jgi:hypothetical protein
LVTINAWIALSITGPCSDTAGIDDRAALRLYREVARENRRRRGANDFKWQGQAFSLDPALYGA